MSDSPLRSIRLRLGLSQQQMADFLGIQRAYLSRIEIDKDPIPEGILAKLIDLEQVAFRVEPVAPVEVEADPALLEKERQRLRKKLRRLQVAADRATESLRLYHQCQKTREVLESEPFCSLPWIEVGMAQWGPTLRQILPEHLETNCRMAQTGVKIVESQIESLSLMIKNLSEDGRLPN